MLRRLLLHLTYANIAATLALVITLLGFAALPSRNVHAATSDGSTWFMGGSSNQIPSCGNCDFVLQPNGIGTVGSSLNPGSYMVLSPSVTILGSKLSVQVDDAPGSGQALTFAMGTDPSHILKCVIAAGQKTCNTGAQTVSFPANSRLGFAVSNSGGSHTTYVKFSWKATPQ